MKLISSKRTKRRIALTFLFSLMLSNLLSLVGPSAQAAVTLTSPSAGTCFQHSGTIANGSLVTVYNIGTIQITLTASEINPGVDSSAGVGQTASTGQAVATTGGSISTNGNVTGNASIYQLHVINVTATDNGTGISNLIFSIGQSKSYKTAKDFNVNSRDKHFGNFLL